MTPLPCHLITIARMRHQETNSRSTPCASKHAFIHPDLAMFNHCYLSNIQMINDISHHARQRLIPNNRLLAWASLKHQHGSLCSIGKGHVCCWYHLAASEFFRPHRKLPGELFIITHAKNASRADSRLAIANDICHYKVKSSLIGWAQT